MKKRQTKSRPALAQLLRKVANLSSLVDHVSRFALTHRHECVQLGSLPPAVMLKRWDRLLALPLLNLRKTGSSLVSLRLSTKTLGLILRDSGRRLLTRRLPCLMAFMTRMTRKQLTPERDCNKPWLAGWLSIPLMKTAKCRLNHLQRRNNLSAVNLCSKTSSRTSRVLSTTKAQVTNS